MTNSGIAGDNVAATNPAGDININLSGTLTVGGTSFPSFIQTATRGTAPAAGLNITSKKVLVSDGARLSTETWRSGQGGHLNIATADLQLTNGGQIRSGSIFAPPEQVEGPPDIPSGPGGTITINGLSNPSQSVLIDGAGSGIFTNAEGTGAGGSMTINANTIILQNGGTFSAATTGIAPSATGGTITVNAEKVALNSQASHHRRHERHRTSRCRSISTLALWRSTAAVRSEAAAAPKHNSLGLLRCHRHQHSL